MRGSTLTVQTSTEFFIETCCNCGVMFAMTSEFKNERNRDKCTFYCPNGHGQSYVGKTDAQLRKEAEARATAAEDQRRAAERELQRVERDLMAAQAEAKRQAKRASAGVCPCCNRSFVQLARHMKSKHPEHGKSIK